MRSRIRCAATVFASAGIIASGVVAPTAGAAPQCTDVGPTTTQCQTNGSAQIVTSPSVTADNWRWPYGGFILSFGGFSW
ncbi:hypothetical protein [Mycolicibacterium pulveris]|uniref:hypothetical protein n=1 Tax=Mycolicibacterium pulveris TaxID=36813 RepID=UPI003CF085E8